MEHITVSLRGVSMRRKVLEQRVVKGCSGAGAGTSGFFFDTWTLAVTSLTILGFSALPVWSQWVIDACISIVTTANKILNLTSKWIVFSIPERVISGMSIDVTHVWNLTVIRLMTPSSFYV